MAAIAAPVNLFRYGKQSVDQRLPKGNAFPFLGMEIPAEADSHLTVRPLRL